MGKNQVKFTVVSPNTGPYLSAVNYFPDGGLHNATFANGVVHAVSRDPVSQLPCRITQSRYGNTIGELAYDYNANGNITQIVDGIDGNYSLNSLSYDGLQRLIGVIEKR